MMVLAGADVVLPDRVLPAASLVIQDGRITAVEPRVIDGPSGATRIDVTGRVIVPGFIDVHVHGVEGHDVLDGSDGLAAVAAKLPRYGVTSFCPTSVACPPGDLRTLLAAVEEQRSPRESSARIAGAHLESNFVNPEFKGAQPAACLRAPRPANARTGQDGFTAAEILEVIAAHRDAVRIVTLAPELDGALDLTRDLAQAGHIVSIGHSGATYEQALEAIDAGVRHATHLFNRMSPLLHRAPGVPGAVLASEHVAAELICDGFHVHPVVQRTIVRTKRVEHVMAITDGTAGSGLPVGTRTRLGSQTIVVTDRTAELEDGTLAGSVLTMDGAFRQLVHQVALTLVEAAQLCATTPARQLGLATTTGHIETGMTADLVVLTPELRVHQTFLAGRPWRNPARSANV